MACTPHFGGLDYRKRAEFLHNYLKQRPDGLEQRTITDPFARGYKNILSYIVGSLCVRSEYRYISKDAQEHLKKCNITDPDYGCVYKKVCKGVLTNEHTIPVSVIVEYLAVLPKNQLTVDYLEDFIEKVSGIAVITTEENKKLNGKLKSKLPSGVTLDAILNDENLHSARYDVVGIAIATKHDAKA